MFQFLQSNLVVIVLVCILVILLLVLLIALASSVRHEVRALCKVYNKYYKAVYKGQARMARRYLKLKKAQPGIDAAAVLLGKEGLELERQERARLDRDVVETESAIK